MMKTITSYDGLEMQVIPGKIDGVKYYKRSAYQDHYKYSHRTIKEKELTPTHEQIMIVLNHLALDNPIEEPVKCLKQVDLSSDKSLGGLFNLNIKSWLKKRFMYLLNSTGLKRSFKSGGTT